MNPYIRRAVAVLEVAGAIAGSVALATGHGRTSGPFWASVLVELAFAAFLGLLAAAGFLLWRDHPLGARLSMVAQVLQIPQITTHLLTYHLQAPGALNFSFSSNWEIGLTADVSVSLALRFRGLVDFPQFALNLLAVACLVVILPRRSRVRALPTRGGVVIR
jgi:hypothetical protein